MNINGLNANSLPSIGGTARPTANGVPGEGFGSAIKDAIDGMGQIQKSAEQEIQKAVTGESQDLHKTIIALQSADLNFQLGLQVRNKLIGAYEEIMRMQI